MVGQTCRTGYFRAGEPREPRQGPSPQRSKPSSVSSLAQLPAAQPASQGWALTKNLGSRPLWLLKGPQGFTLMLPQEQSCAKRALWPCPGCPAGCPRSQARPPVHGKGLAWAPGCHPTRGSHNPFRPQAPFWKPYLAGLPDSSKLKTGSVSCRARASGSDSGHWPCSCRVSSLLSGQVGWPGNIWSSLE